MRQLKKVKIKQSIRPDKKLMAHFLSDDGKTTTVHFGAKGYDDYTTARDKEQRDRYHQRHQCDRIDIHNTISNTRESTIKT